MSDLISREALRKAFHERIWHFDKSSWDEANALIDNAPTIDPEKVLIANVNFDEDKLKEIVQTEVIDRIKNGELVLKEEEKPQGEWIKTNELIGEHFNNVFVCNQCGARAVDKLKFCPECGADMRGAK